MINMVVLMQRIAPVVFVVILASVSEWDRLIAAETNSSNWLIRYDEANQTIDCRLILDGDASSVSVDTVKPSSMTAAIVRAIRLID